MEEPQMRDFYIHIIIRRKIKARDFAEAYDQAALWSLDENSIGYGAEEIPNSTIHENAGAKAGRASEGAFCAP